MARHSKKKAGSKRTGEHVSIPFPLPKDNDYHNRVSRSPLHPPEVPSDLEIIDDGIKVLAFRSNAALWALFNEIHLSPSSIPQTFERDSAYIFPIGKPPFEWTSETGKNYRILCHGTPPGDTIVARTYPLFSGGPTTGEDLIRAFDEVLESEAPIEQKDLAKFGRTLAMKMILQRNKAAQLDDAGLGFLDSTVELALILGQIVQSLRLWDYVRAKRANRYTNQANAKSRSGRSQQDAKDIVTEGRRLLASKAVRLTRWALAQELFEEVYGGQFQKDEHGQYVTDKDGRKKSLKGTGRFKVSKIYYALKPLFE